MTFTVRKRVRGNMRRQWTGNLVGFFGEKIAKSSWLVTTTWRVTLTRLSIIVVHPRREFKAKKRNNSAILFLFLSNLDKTHCYYQKMSCATSTLKEIMIIRAKSTWQRNTCHPSRCFIDPWLPCRARIRRIDLAEYRGFLSKYTSDYIIPEIQFLDIPLDFRLTCLYVTWNSNRISE